MSEYALDWNRHRPAVASGGADNQVCVWNLEDCETSLNASMGRATIFSEAPQLQAKYIFHGHTKTVESVAFDPTDTSATICCSVSDDRSMRLWDGRSHDNQVAVVHEAHTDDINCISWNPLDTNMIVTGSSDGSINLYDRRSFSSDGTATQPVQKFSADLSNITNIQWSPHSRSHFASAGEDCIVSIWDVHARQQDALDDGLPPGLLFRHRGHRAGVVDFDWSSSSPWTIASMSDDSTNPRLGGGTLQVWRICDLLREDMSTNESKLLNVLDRANAQKEKKKPVSI